MKSNSDDGVPIDFGPKKDIDSIISRSKRPRKPRKASADQPVTDANADPGQGVETDWRAFLIRKKGKPLGCLANAIAALTYADEWLVWIPAQKLSKYPQSR